MAEDVLFSTMSSRRHEFPRIRNFIHRGNLHKVLSTPILLVDGAQYERIEPGKGGIKETLGMFCPIYELADTETSVIIMCMDAIVDAARRSDLPVDVLFTKVLAHELMHAFFSGSDHSTHYFSMEFARWFEEAHANAFALQAMENAHNQGFIDASHLKNLRVFVSKQPTEYAFGGVLQQERHSLHFFTVMSVEDLDRCGDANKAATRDAWLAFVRKTMNGNAGQYNRSAYDKILNDLNV
ncbi:MAG: hypothetical protein ACK45R_01580 [Candidatus Kapaibacterium sp.]